MCRFCGRGQAYPAQGPGFAAQPHAKMINCTLNIIPGPQSIEFSGGFYTSTIHLYYYTFEVFAHLRASQF